MKALSPHLQLLLEGQRIHSKGEQSCRPARQWKRYGLHRKQCPSERIAWAKSKLLIYFSCILFLGKHTSHIICCLASIGMSVASVLSSPKVYCIERGTPEATKSNVKLRAFPVGPFPVGAGVRSQTLSISPKCAGAKLGSVRYGGGCHREKY